MSINSLNNFPSSQKLLTLREPFYLFDIGARRGFHPVLPKSLRKFIRRYITNE